MLNDEAKEGPPVDDPKEPTLRDQFAMAALSGLASDAATSARGPAYSARCAYRIADAMMREREITLHEAMPETA